MAVYSNKFNINVNLGFFVIWIFFCDLKFAYHIIFLILIISSISMDHFFCFLSELISSDARSYGFAKLLW